MDILYEDNHLLVVNKPVGMLTQGDKTGEISLLDYSKAYIKKKYNKPNAVFLGLVHRLDRPTSGVLVFGKTSKSLSRLCKQFKERQVEKTYYAIVAAPFPYKEGRLEHWLVRNHKQNKSYAYAERVPNSKKALLSYKKIKNLKRYTLLEITLETGRHHQIRSQLSTLGFPIKGDLKYGSPRSNSDKSIALHSRKLTLYHPIKKNKMDFFSPFPAGTLWVNFNHF